MPPKLPPRRLAVDVRIDAETHDWLMARVGPGKPFDDVGHAVATALAMMRRRPAPRRAKRGPHRASRGGAEAAETRGPK